MKKAQNATDLRLYVDSYGVVWFGTSREQGKAHVSECPISELIQQPMIREAERIRILGSRRGAAMICALYDARQLDPAGMPQIIQIGTPSCIPKESQDDPYQILSLMDDLRLPSSCGGWHEISKADNDTYGLIDTVMGNASVEDIKAKLEKHPAYAAISFIPT
ncbi:MAG: hypothetical protein HRF40_12280, partial [Nitrososphaera sp.]